MKITLAAAHQVTKNDAIPLSGCLGILVLAAVLKKESFNCEIVDLVDYHKIEEPDFHVIASQVAQDILYSKPDVVGINTISDSLAVAIEVIRVIKKIAPNITIVFGGPGVSYIAKKVMLEFPEIDYIIRGEADESFPQFLNHMRERKSYEGIAGVVYRLSGQIIDNGWSEPVKDLDELPIPRYDLCTKNYNKYTWFDNIYGFQIEVGRGCPYSCNFCSASEYFKRKFRIKSVTRLMQELKTIPDVIDRQVIRFTHDLLTVNRKYVVELCESLIKTYPQIKWKCMARLDNIDPDLIDLMVKAGCVDILLGIEAATPKMQRHIGKRLDLKHADVILESLRTHKIKFIMSFIVGIPEEDTEDLEAMFAFAIKAKSICGQMCTIHIHPLMPDHGSRIYQENSEGLVFDEKNSITRFDSAISNKWKSVIDLIKAYPEIFIRFYRWEKPLDKHSRGYLNSYVYAHFYYLLDKIIPFSLMYSYQIAGDMMGKIIVDSFHELTEKDVLLMDNNKYDSLITNINTNIKNLDSLEKKQKDIFTSLLRFEVANYNLRKAKEPFYVKVVEISHDMVHLSEWLAGKRSMENIKAVQKRIGMTWDPLEQDIKVLDLERSMRLFELSPGIV